jgi:hypothetical protein
MLSYLLVRKLRESWKNSDMTVEEGLKLLATLCTVRIQVTNTEKCPIIINCVPELREDLQQLFQLANIPSPEILPAEKPTTPRTRKKLKNCGQ